MYHEYMKKITLYNLKLLKYKKGKLYGNFGVWAEKNNNGTISFKLMKRIKKINNTKNYSPFRCTLGHYPSMQIEEAEEEAKKIIELCNKGLHPREYEKNQKENFLQNNIIKSQRIKKLLIIGSGGHAVSVANVALSIGYTDIQFVDNNKAGKNLLSYNVIDETQAFANYKSKSYIIAVGDNLIRKKIFNDYNKIYKDLYYPILIHKSAVISCNLKIGEGTVVMPNSTLGPNSIIGAFCIINTSASIDHDCSLDNFSSIAPGCILGGNVSIGKNTSISIGTIIRHRINIGNNVLIGASSYVDKEIEDNILAFGIPVKKIRNRKPGEKFL